MAALPLPDPGINPAHDATIAGCKHLPGVEVGLRGAGKELLPEGPDATPPLKALTVRLRSSILEGAVVAHELHDGVDVMAVDCVVEALHHIDNATGRGVPWVFDALSNNLARPQPVLTA